LEVILDRVEVVYETPDIAEWHVRVRKVNKTRAIVGFVIVREQLSNEHLGEFKVLKKQGCQLLRGRSQITSHRKNDFF